MKEFDLRPEALRNEFWQLYRLMPEWRPFFWMKFKKRMEDEGRLTKSSSNMVMYQS
jgi:hypothetical protein